MIILCKWEGPSFSMEKIKCGSNVICAWESHFFSAASGWIPSADCQGVRFRNFSGFYLGLGMRSASERLL